MDRNSQMIIIISSPSGAGKTSICKQLLEYDKSLSISISDTTRVPRDNERNGKDYNFIDEAKFKKRIANNEYIEYATVFGNLYGSLHTNVKNLLNSGFDVLFDIDWQGAKQLKSSEYRNILSFFIVPPSKEAIFSRLQERAKSSGDNEDAINKRMSSYETEISHKNNYDYIIVNDNFHTCVNEIQLIIENKRKNLREIC